MDFQKRHKTMDNCFTLFWCLTLKSVTAYNKRFGQPKNSASQVDFFSICPTGQVGNKVNVKPWTLTHLAPDHLSPSTHFPYRETPDSPEAAS